MKKRSSDVSNQYLGSDAVKGVYYSINSHSERVYLILPISQLFQYSFLFARSNQT